MTGASATEYGFVVAGELRELGQECWVVLDPDRPGDWRGSVVLDRQSEVVLGGMDAELVPVVVPVVDDSEDGREVVPVIRPLGHVYTEGPYYLFIRFKPVSVVVPMVLPQGVGFAVYGPDIIQTRPCSFLYRPPGVGAVETPGFSSVPGKVRQSRAERRANKGHAAQ